VIRVIEFLSKWAEGIVIAVVIATIMELILPNSQNKKYVKMIMGVYIVFTIVSPIIGKWSDVDFHTWNIEEMLEENTKVASTTSVGDNNHYITALYIKNLQKDMQSKLEAKGYCADKIAVQVQEEIEEMPIEKITFEGVRRKTEGVQAVNKVEIMKQEKEEEGLDTEEVEELKIYFSQTYAVLKEHIEIS